MAILEANELSLVPGATILLVDDNAAYREMATMALSSVGHLVQPCSSPEAALVCAGGNPLWQLLVTDVVMAKMNGVQLAAEILRICPAIKVLFCSGHPATALARQGIDVSSGEFLMKPVSLRALSTKIGEMVGTSKAVAKAL